MQQLKAQVLSSADIAAAEELAVPCKSVPLQAAAQAENGVHTRPAPSTAAGIDAQAHLSTTAQVDGAVGAGVPNGSEQCDAHPALASPVASGSVKLQLEHSGEIFEDLIAATVNIIMTTGM